jgi:hypothetical protein
MIYVTNPSRFQAKLIELKGLLFGPLPQNEIDRLASAKSHPVYNAYRFRAEGIKIILQMLIGSALAGILVIKLICRAVGWGARYWAFQMTTLDLVGHALAYSAGIELAYTLFTPGPDEALDPVLMGLAAAALLAFAQINTLVIGQAASAALYCACIGGLFAVRKYFTKED